ncbi:hypothetical protein HMI54_008500 [Coelomomyces lativittatus]|nr:hypothetical protein HMI54_008500 [Coelomomyces lativittatus]KAJ1510447.1 hypothetical protein HMI55_006988 [Coelomomyces lativittatus]
MLLKKLPDRHIVLKNEPLDFISFLFDFYEGAKKGFEIFEKYNTEIKLKSFEPLFYKKTYFNPYLYPDVVLFVKSGPVNDLDLFGKEIRDAEDKIKRFLENIVFYVLVLSFPRY